MRMKVKIYFDDGRLLHEQDFCAIERSGELGFSFERSAPGYAHVPRENGLTLKGYAINCDVDAMK